MSLGTPPRALAIALAALTLAACQAPTPTGGRGSWVFGVNRFTATGPLAAPPSKGPARPAPGSAASAEAEVVAAPAVQGGSLVVSFGHLLAPAKQRRLAAVTADVEKVRISLAGNGVTKSVVIPRAAIVNGQTSHTFTGLPGGVLTVTIEALGAGDVVLGKDVQQATVTVGGTTTVTSTVQLTPTLAVPRPLPSPTLVSGSSGGGANGGVSGALRANVTLADGAPVITPTLVGTFHLGGLPTPRTVAANETGGRYGAVSVCLDATGQVWFGGDADATGPLALGRVTTGGTLSSVPLPVEPWNLDLGHGGTTLLAHDNRQLVRLAADATHADLGVRPTFLQVAEPTAALRFEARDSTLVAVADGMPEATVGAPAVSAFTEQVLSLPGGKVVANFTRFDAATSRNFHRVVAIATDLTIAWEHEFEGYAHIAADSRGHVFALDVDGRRMRELAPDGSTVRAVALPARANRVYVDPLDRVWAHQASLTSYQRLVVGAPAADDVITRFAADGSVAAFYHVGQGADVERMAVTADDHLWVASLGQGLIHLQLDPL